MGLLDSILNSERKNGLEREIDREKLNIKDLREMRSKELVERIDGVIPYLEELTLVAHENDDTVREVCDIYVDNLYKSSDSSAEVDEKIEYMCHYARTKEVCPSNMLEQEEIFKSSNEQQAGAYFTEKYEGTSMSSTLRDPNEYLRYANYKEGLLDVINERDIKDPMLSFAVKNIDKSEEDDIDDDKLLDSCLNGFVRSLTDAEKETFLPLPVDTDRRTELSIDEAFYQSLKKFPPVNKIDKNKETKCLSDKFRIIAIARGLSEDAMFKEALADMKAHEINSENEILKTNELNDYMINFMDSLSIEERMYLIPRNAEESGIMYKQYCMEFCRIINGYANLNDDMLDKMAHFLKNKKCLEVMAGSGMLGAGLKERGIDIIVTEKDRPENNKYAILRDIPSLCDIQYIDALDAIRNYGSDIDVLIISWPPYDNPIAADCVELLHKVNPDADILYIGEDEGGCTADDRFFEITEYVDEPLCVEINKAKRMNVYSGIHDTVELLKPNL